MKAVGGILDQTVQARDINEMMTRRRVPESLNTSPLLFTWE
jgi:hypothetical protein